MSASYCNLAKRETKVSADIELASRGKGDLLAFARHRAQPMITLISVGLSCSEGL